MKSSIKSQFFENFEITRYDMVPPFATTHQLPVLSPEERIIAEKTVFREQDEWSNLSQEHQYCLSATPSTFQGLYQALLNSLSQYLKATIIIKTPLDIMIYDHLDAQNASYEEEHIHNDWTHYANCLPEVTEPKEHHYYLKNHAIGLILPLALPHCGSGLQLYDAFEGEDFPPDHQPKEQYIPYGLGQATLFCPFQYHAMSFPKQVNFTAQDKRMTLQAFLIKSFKNNTPSWHLFRLNPQPDSKGEPDTPPPLCKC